MFDLERLSFSEIRDTEPDRFQRVDLAAGRIVSDDGPRFVVSRNGSDSSHVVSLVDALGHYWGSCSCDGFQKWNSGPCSHLCAVFRAENEGLVEIETGRVESVSVEVLNADLERSDSDVEQRKIADGHGGYL